jgi:proline dehydrogenase
MKRTRAFGIPTRCTSHPIPYGPTYLADRNRRIFKDSRQKLDVWASGSPIKLVRGAYLHLEPRSALVRSKHEADEQYDDAVRSILLSMPNSLMLATHNHQSIVRAWDLIRTMSAPGIRTRAVTFAQLHGMGDDITFGLAQGIRGLCLPLGLHVSVAKYIPYGPLHEVLPYLVRRAQENRGILGGSMRERDVLYEELKRRIYRPFRMEFWAS